MDKKRQLLVISLLFVGWAFGGVISDKILSVSRTKAQEADRAAVQKWEYCALTRSAYVNASREGYWIIYFRDTGPQVADVQSSVTEGNGASMAKAIAKLGAEGWEMVGQGPLDVRSGATNALYFKRQK